MGSDQNKVVYLTSGRRSLTEIRFTINHSDRYIRLDWSVNGLAIRYSYARKDMTPTTLSSIPYYNVVGLKCQCVIFLIHWQIIFSKMELVRVPVPPLRMYRMLLSIFAVWSYNWIAIPSRVSINSHSPSPF